MPAPFGDASLYSGQWDTPELMVFLEIIGDQPADTLDVGRVHRDFAGELAANLLGFIPPEVATHPLTAQELACAGNVETSLSSLVSLQFGHLLLQPLSFLFSLLQAPILWKGPCPPGPAASPTSICLALRPRLA